MSTYQTASTQPMIENNVYVHNGIWAQHSAASVQARISVETSNGSQGGEENKTAEARFANQQNGSMSVMSLNGP